MLTVSFLAFAFEGKWDGNLIMLTASRLVFWVPICPWQCWNIPASCNTFPSQETFSHHGEHFPSQRLEHFLAKIGKNWPKRAVRIMLICGTTRTQVLRVICFIPGPELKFHGVGIIHIGPTITNKSVENLFPIEMINLKNPAQTPVTSSKRSGNQRWFNVNIKSCPLWSVF